MTNRCDKCKHYIRKDDDRLEWCKALGIGVEPSFYCANWEPIHVKVQIPGTNKEVTLWMRDGRLIMEIKKVGYKNAIIAKVFIDNPAIDWDVG